MKIKKSTILYTTVIISIIYISINVVSKLQGVNELLEREQKVCEKATLYVIERNYSGKQEKMKEASTILCNEARKELNER